MTAPLPQDSRPLGNPAIRHKCTYRASLRFLTHSFNRIRYALFHCKKIFAQNNNSKYTVTSVSSAFRRAMLCTKSELRFKQSSLNHRTRNLRSVGNLQLSPYPLYRYAIVLLVFPLKVSRLFLLFSSNNIPLRGRYICAFNSALFSAYYQPRGQHFHHELLRNVQQALSYMLFVFRPVWTLQ